MQVCTCPQATQFLSLTFQETYREQKEELLAQNSNVTINKFQLSCPVCRETIGNTQQHILPLQKASEQRRSMKLYFSGESRYNLCDLLSAPPPLESEEEAPVYKESEEVTLILKCF